MLDGTTGKWMPLKIDNVECLLMCSLLCASDVIAAVSIVSYEKEPNLFSIVFGEGITNDAVSIILFNTVMKYASKKSSNKNKITWSTPIEIIGSFVNLGFWSLFVGIIVGLISAYILKSIRAFSKNAVSEVIFLFCFGYISYAISEITELSGIITLLTSGIVMA